MLIRLLGVVGCALLWGVHSALSLQPQQSSSSSSTVMQPLVCCLKLLASVNEQLRQTPGNADVFDGCPFNWSTPRDRLLRLRMQGRLMAGMQPLGQSCQHERKLVAVYQDQQQQQQQRQQMMQQRAVQTEQSSSDDTSPSSSSSSSSSTGGSAVIDGINDTKRTVRVQLVRPTRVAALLRLQRQRWILI